ncbi:hypothetical protein RND81_06G249100 [Saponaria officinalis]|uniref:F-box protein SKIP8 n=1 Tax=Saponaria officinalis TaxID=3572 RepID=A0AAW1KE77_SAPOF
MEITFLSFICSQPIIVAFICCLLAVFAVRFSSFSSNVSRRRFKTASFSRDLTDSSCSGDFACNGVVLRSGSSDSTSAVANGVVLRSGSSDSTSAVANGVVSSAEMPGVVVTEKQTGASMMEQLVPEITTHALSYLDYPSLCRLSMTNSLMRKAANDDNAWKILYHKDFTLEQDTLRPANGWKAYYAATRAIVNINADFFSIIRERSLPAMSQLWLNADYVKCTHAIGESVSGYTAVMESWRMEFNWGQPADGLQVRDVRARVLSDVAWVTMKAYVDMNAGLYNVTNVYECHDGRWYMVHHHCSVMLVDANVVQQIVHA